MHQTIKSKKAPEAAGPYSQALLVDGFLYCSGQLGIDPATNLLVAGDAAKQAEQVMENIGAILNDAGMDYCDIVKSTVFIRDMNEFGKINSVYASYFEEPYPARSCIAVRELPKDALVEIEVVAHK